jgi:hypothetical protein
MLQKLSLLTVADKTGVGWLQIFHLYRGSWRRYAFIGDFVKTSIKTMIKYPKRIRGKRYKPLRPGYRCRGLLTQLVKNKFFFDRARISCYSSTLILLKKRDTFKSKSFFGPGIRLLYKWQYSELFIYFL